MNKLISMSVLCVFVIILYAQSPISGFVIINDGAVNNISAYENALNRNNLDKYRHIDQRAVMIFKSGVEVELLSATEVLELGLSVDMNVVNQSDEDRMKNKEFDLHSSGRILELVTPQAK